MGSRPGHGTTQTHCYPPCPGGPPLALSGGLWVQTVWRAPCPPTPAPRGQPPSPWRWDGTGPGCEAVGVSLGPGPLPPARLAGVGEDGACGPR